MPANAAGRAAPWAGQQLHGRTLPAGILVALIGTPYLSWLLWRSRSAAAPR